MFFVVSSPSTSFDLVMKRMQPNHIFRLLLLPLIFLGWSGVNAQTVFVWPGDASDNGVVNHIDLLYLGRHFGLQGPARDSISINWTAHETPKWFFPVPGRIDPAHADCNGDGDIDVVDAAVIETNYGLDNGMAMLDSSSISTIQTNPALTFEFPSDSLAAGSRDTISLVLGTASLPIDSLQGFAATITYDTSLIDTAYVWFGGSWLDTTGTNLISLEKYEPGNLAIAATRTDRNNAYQGQGRIGGVVIVMHDNLKTHAAAASLQLSIPQALCLDSAGNIVSVSIVEQEIPVYQPSNELIALTYPVPAGDILNISLLNPSNGLVSGRLMDATGRIVREFKLMDGYIALQVGGLNSGFYLVELTRGEAIVRKRIILSRIE